MRVDFAAIRARYLMPILVVVWIGASIAVMSIQPRMVRLAAAMLILGLAGGSGVMAFGVGQQSRYDTARQIMAMRPQMHSDDVVIYYPVWLEPLGRLYGLPPNAWPDAQTDLEHQSQGTNIIELPADLQEAQRVWLIVGSNSPGSGFGQQAARLVDVIAGRFGLEEDDPAWLRTELSASFSSAVRIDPGGIAILQERRFDDASR
jgi:hypothetical protein